MTRDDDGHRTYKIKHLVQAHILDGPAIVIQASGLPAAGDQWNFDNDIDVWAFCLPSTSVNIHQEKTGDPNEYWAVENTFTTKPMRRCQTETIENPLLEPQKVSGSFVKYTDEATTDRYGYLINNSSHETIRGPNVQFDASRPTVSISQNVPDLELPLLSQLANTVNDSPLWGLPARCVKLSAISWERVLYGICTFYFTRKFEFDINWDTFDKTVLDEGTKVLNGEWATDAADLALASRNDPQPEGSTWKLLPINGSPPDPNNPQHFIRYKDKNGENTRALLDENGEPLGVTTYPFLGEINPNYLLIEKYLESNLLLLGIPTDLAVSS